MHEDREGLELSLKLMFEGISPTLRAGLISDYSSLKSDLKKIKVNLTVKEIDHIALLILERLGIPSESHYPPAAIKALVEGEEIITQIGQKLIDYNSDLNSDNIISVLEIISRKMPSFHKKYLYPDSSRHNQFNHAFLSREKVKSQLDALFNRVLTKDEFHLLLTEWHRYMAIVMDWENSDNKLKEQIKDTKADYEGIIKALEKKILHTNALINNLKSINRFPNHALSIQETILRNNQEELLLYNQLLSRLRTGNGQELNSYNLRTQAYFSVMFCAQTLGLAPNKRRKDGNPLLSLLEILLGLDESDRDEGDVRNSMSQIYVAYKQHIEATMNKILVDELLTECRNNQECFSTIRMSNIKFQSSLLFLICVDPFAEFLKQRNKETVEI